MAERIVADAARGDRGSDIDVVARGGAEAKKGAPVLAKLLRGAERNSGRMTRGAADEGLLVDENAVDPGTQATDLGRPLKIPPIEIPPRRPEAVAREVAGTLGPTGDMELPIRRTCRRIAAEAGVGKGLSGVLGK